MSEDRKYQDIIYQICSIMDEGCQSIKPCCVGEVAEFIKIAVGIARQNGLKEALERERK